MSCCTLTCCGYKILAITCDNMTNNDLMVEELSKLLPGFTGEVNQVRCFTHILNLVVKSLIQFDAKADKDEAKKDADVRELAELACDLDTEEAQICSKPVAKGGAEDPLADDNDPDNEVDTMEDLTVHLVKLVLAKIHPPWPHRMNRQFSINLGLPETLLPRNVQRQ